MYFDHTNKIRQLDDLYFKFDL